MVPPHGLLIQSQASYWLDDSGVLRTAAVAAVDDRRRCPADESRACHKITVVRRPGAAGSRTLTMLIKSQLYCLLILRPQSGARGESCRLGSGKIDGLQGEASRERSSSNLHSQPPDLRFAPATSPF